MPGGKKRMSQAYFRIPGHWLLVYAWVLVRCPCFGVSAQSSLNIRVDLEPKFVAGLIAPPWPVQVMLPDGTPVEGAWVSIRLPEAGPGGTFAQGSRTATFKTDDRGIALVEGLRANSELGRYREGVTIEVRLGARLEVVTIMPENVPPGPLAVSPVEGAGRANVKDRRQREAGVSLAVRVTDSSGRPVWGARVRFELEGTEYAWFAGESTKRTAETNREGLAGARLVGLGERAGRFEIRALAWVPGFEKETMGKASICRTNEWRGGCGGGCKALLTLAVMAGGYGGACAAKKVPPCKPQSPGGGGPTVLGLTAGSPVFGPPR